MIKLIDNAINRITMYRLVVYYLIFLLGAAIALSALGILPYDPFALLFTIGFAVAACAVTNALFARVFNVPANVESVYISALILALIITPLTSLNDLWFIGWASVLAMSSKYIVAINRKHLFNPVAFAVVVTALTIDQTASWWVATGAMLPFVLIGGLLVVRQIRRFGLVLSFLAAAFGTTTVFTLIGHGDLLVGAAIHADPRADDVLRLHLHHRAADHAADPPLADHLRRAGRAAVLAGSPLRGFLLHAGTGAAGRQPVLVPRQPQDQADPDAEGADAALGGRLRVRVHALAPAGICARAVHGVDARSRRPGQPGQPPLLHAGVRADRTRTAGRRQVLLGAEQL